MRSPVLNRILSLGAALALLVSGWPPAVSAEPAGPAGPAEVSQSVAHDVSAPLGDAPVSPSARNLTERPLRITGMNFGAATQPDGALQQTAVAAAATLGIGFAGVGKGDYGFTPNAAPPDTNLAVGATQVVQWVNESFAVFDKTTHALLKGPINGNSLWAGFGGACQTNNDGDPIVQYDQAANRWIMTQFSVSTTPYLQCVAVSTTADATGTWNRYAFNYGTTQFPDYPKLGVWSDGYYITYNIFNNGTTYAGPKTCAWDRTAMINGAASATQVCFQLGTGVGPLLPADLDGNTAPPAGAPNYQLTFGSNLLAMYKFHVDFATPANSTLTGPANIAVATFSTACNGGGTCIPQSGTKQKLDSLGDRLMYRLAYRNMGTYEAAVVNHSVTAGSSVGLRWYELRGLGGTPAVYQQGTFAPDAKYRWMGSIAMDKLGNIAVGYSVSSSSTFPSIAVTGRVPTDPLGTMQAETLAKAGGGSQLRTLSRWGDYSAMQVDPTDDCTFWFTTEYLKSSGTFNWSTWIVPFKLPGC